MIDRMGLLAGVVVFFMGSFLTSCENPSAPSEPAFETVIYSGLVRTTTFSIPLSVPGTLTQVSFQQIDENSQSIILGVGSVSGGQAVFTTSDMKTKAGKARELLPSYIGEASQSVLCYYADLIVGYNSDGQKEYLALQSTKEDSRTWYRLVYSPTRQRCFAITGAVDLQVNLGAGMNLVSFEESTLADGGIFTTVRGATLDEVILK